MRRGCWWDLGEWLLDTCWVIREEGPARVWDDLLYCVIDVGEGKYPLGFLVITWLAWRVGLG